MLIWYYHRILPQKGRAAVSIATFEKQIALLKMTGHNFIDCAQLASFLFEGKPLPPKTTMITFDDGWADNLFFATPILAKFAVRAVLALNTGLANLDSCEIRSQKDYTIKDSKLALADAAIRNDKSSFLTAAEIKAMFESGCWDIQSHGNSHLACYHSLDKIRGFYPEKQHWCMEYALGEPPFDGAPRAKFASTLSYPKTALSEELKEKLRSAKNDFERLAIIEKNAKNGVVTIESAEEFSARVRYDLLESKNKIKELIGKEPIAFFCPWGDSSPALRKIALECGFKMQFTTIKSALSKDCDPTILPRVPAPGGISAFIASYLKVSLSSYA